MTFTLRHYRDLVRVLLTKELKLRYKFTALGYAWSVLHPLAFALVYFVVIKKVMRVGGVDFLSIIVAMFPWQWFQNSLTASNNFFLGNWTLIKKVRFPRSALVLAGVLNDTVHFVASIPIIVLFMLGLGAWPSAAWLYQIPLLVSLQLALATGLALLVGTTNLFFRDLERVTTILAMLWFFATPVLFRSEMVPASMAWLLLANPLAPLVECWRSVFLEGTLPPLLFARAAGWAAAAFGIGVLVYRKHEWRFAEIV